MREAQEVSGIRGSFLLDTFLWTSKEKYPACQCGNWHLINRRVSDTLIPLTLTLSHKGRGDIDSDHGFRRPKEVPVVQAHHERNQHTTVRPVEGSLSKDLIKDSLN
jgi:hypothetical protein